MPLFYSPNRSGKGVSKSEPVKKPFFRFFELLGRKFWKLLQLNIVYLLVCLPLVTFGPATAALTQVMRKFTLEQPMFVVEEFFSAFKKNFKQSFVIGIVDVLFTGASAYTAFYYWTGGDTVMLTMTMISAVIFTTLNIYIYPQIVSLNLKMPAIIKNSALLGVIGLLSNLVVLVVFAALTSVFVLFFPLTLAMILILPAFLSFVSVFCVYPVIQRCIITPYYESRNEKNPEIPDYEAEVNIFTDLGGKEQAINKKNVKIGGKVIK